MDGFVVGALFGGLLLCGAEELSWSAASEGLADGTCDGLVVGELFIFCMGPITNDSETTFVIFGTFNFIAESFKVFTNKPELIDLARDTLSRLYVD